MNMSASVYMMRLHVLVNGVGGFVLLVDIAVINS